MSKLMRFLWDTRYFEDISKELNFHQVASVLGQGWGRDASGLEQGLGMLSFLNPQWDNFATVYTCVAQSL